MYLEVTELLDVLELQLNSFWKNQYNISNIKNQMEDVISELNGCIEKNVLFANRKVEDKYLNTRVWPIFLYLLSFKLAQNNMRREADVVFYLNRVMHSVDWFYEVRLPKHFGFEHPIGSVMGRADYGDYFYFMQGCTIGGNYWGVLERPCIGDFVLMYPNSSVIGSSKIGNNVIISNGCRVFNETVPSNSLVFGESPHLNIVVNKEKTESILRCYWDIKWRINERD